jgi:lysyl-tRNA synthetase class 2
MNTPFIEENDQTRTRREHLERIRALVGNVYPNKFQRTNVTQSRGGEDTITALADREVIKRLVNSNDFSAAFDSLAEKVKSGERPTPEELAPVNSKLNEITVRVSGRLAVPPRVMGKAAFVHLSDGKERLQIYVRRDDVREMPITDARTLDGWELFGLLDHGDFIGVEGFLFVTKTGELSVHVRTFEFLSKALLPMPDKMHGVSDPEIRQRQRYVDLIASSLKIEKDSDKTDKDDAHTEGTERELTTREVFERRSHMIREMRRYLDDHGYIEVETPILSPIASGAAAKPFETYHKALNIKLYARIAPELYLKRLLVGGFERVYELNRNFRNEGISYKHSPEFTMLEFYTAYKDVNWMMDFCEEMLRRIVREVTGSTKVKFGHSEINFTSFNKISMKDAIAEHWDTAIMTVPNLVSRPHNPRAMTRGNFESSWLNDPKQLRYLAGMCNAMHAVPYFFQKRPPTPGFTIIESSNMTEEPDHERLAEELTQIYSEKLDATNDSEEIKMQRMVTEIFEALTEPCLVQPTFITNFPKVVSPLSKASPDDPTVAERFELYITGMECANGFSELNDPVEQHQRFEEQTKQREGGDEEAMQMDVDYVRALSYGMPPAAGIGIGIDRLAMLLTNRRSIRDVILFPHMRPRHQIEEETKDAEGDKS